MVCSLFAAFARTGSACATVKAARQQHLAFPRRCARGVHKGELLWAELDHSQVLSVLHNPRYAGAFVYGRHQSRRSVDGVARVQRLPRDEWVTLISDAHEGYISWDEFERNEQRLRESAQAMGADRRRGPPREGPALLQGLVLCGLYPAEIPFAASSAAGRPEITSCGTDRIAARRTFRELAPFERLASSEAPIRVRVNNKRVPAAIAPPEPVAARESTRRRNSLVLLSRGRGTVLERPHAVFKLQHQQPIVLARGP
jgi:hypothetical protein